MRLTLHTDYAFRTLMYLTANSDRLITIDEIANAYNISNNHLAKVVNTLVKAEIIESIRGKNGGLRLAPNASKLRLGAIVRITEPDLDLVECFTANNHCVISPVCQLKHVFNQALSNFFKELDNFTLSDITLMNNK